MQFVLYYYDSCPFCQRVLVPLRKNHWPVELRDIMNNPQYRDELVRGNGRTTVPCLHITDSQGKESWMLESLDILMLLKRHFSSNSR